jgi:hypothetical protein
MVLGKIQILCILTIEYLIIVGMCELVKDLGPVLGTVLLNERAGMCIAPQQEQHPVSNFYRL